MPANLVPLLLLAPVLVMTGYCDLRHMRIPNAFSIAAVALFVASAPVALTADECLMRVVTAGTVFALGFALFAFGMVGGGDVKILSALFLFIPTATLSAFLLLFSAAMLIGIAAMPVLRALPDSAIAGWVSLQPKARFPMGISIAMAGLAHPLVVAAIA